MSYYFFLGETMLPVAPSKLDVTINGRNKTINLIETGEVNLINTTGLSDVSFTFLLPNQAYPFANYDASLTRGIAGALLGNAFSFQKAERFLTAVKNLKADKNPTRFIVSRMGFDYSLLWSTNLLCTVEDYTTTEDAKNGTDVEVSIKLKEYVPYGTKEVEVKKGEDGKETLTVKENRFAPDKIYPHAVRVTHQQSILETVKEISGGNLDWRQVAAASGLQNPLEKHLKGKVLRLD